MEIDPKTKTDPLKVPDLVVALPKDKRLAAIELLANGDINDIPNRLKIRAKTFSEWLQDSEFVEAVDLRQAEVARLKRWGLMKMADPMICRLEQSVGGAQKLTTSEEKSIANVLKSLGIIIEQVPIPLPVGEIKIQLGSKRQTPAPIPQPTEVEE